MSQVFLPPRRLNGGFATHLRGAPSAMASSSFGTPLRYIFDAADLAEWGKSKAHKDLLNFVASINAAVASKSCKGGAEASKPSPVVSRLVEVLGELDTMVDSTPPTAQPMRYGNKAFRSWHDKLVERAPVDMERLLGGLHPGAAQELLSYFIDSFGNATRIDYGTGHETTFVVLLCGWEDAPILRA